MQRAAFVGILTEKRKDGGGGVCKENRDPLPFCWSYGACCWRAVQALWFIDRFAKYDTPAVAVLAALYAQLKEVPAKEIFQQLRQVTGNYTVPEDACPTYAKT